MEDLPSCTAVKSWVRQSTSLNLRFFIYEPEEGDRMISKFPSPKIL